MYIPDLQELGFIEQRFATLLSRLQQKPHVSSSLLKLFVSVVVSGEGTSSGERSFKRLEVNNGRHVVELISEDVFSERTIWGCTRIERFLNTELGKALGECRLGLDMFISRIPNGTDVDSFGSLTLAPPKFSHEQEQSLTEKFDSKDFIFPSSLFLLGNLGGRKTQAALPVFMLSGGFSSDGITLSKNTAGIDLIFENASSGEIVAIDGEKWLQECVHLNGKNIPLERIFSQIIHSYKKWSGYVTREEIVNPLKSIFGLLFVPSGNDYRSRTALLCPVVLSIEDIPRVVANIKVLVKLLGGLLEKYLAHAIEGNANERLLLANTYSAIGSIMSRNGSHNIGSHVLSALSHNVGTMPDDRVLYQYIQHRMDYIATATTEFPQWTTPTMFVAGLMKNFYAQRHLLDYISRSEGLRAYKFQERNLDDATRMNQHGTIRIFLRRFYELGKMTETEQKELPHPHHRYLTHDINDHAWSIYYFFGEKARMFQRKFSPTSSEKRVQYAVSESGGTAQFLEYDEQFTPDWKQDVRLAIPGGIVGQHAFYTILENVIRNAAKHGWDAKADLREKDLEINIDFQEKDDAIVFTVGDNMSDVFGAAKMFWEAFFKEFDSDEKESSIEKWKRFLTDNPNIQNPDSAKGENSANQQGNVSSDGEKNEGKTQQEKWWKELLNAVGGTEFNKKTEDEKRKAEDNARRFLPRLFVAPLTSGEAAQLERYLRTEEKDAAPSSDLPLCYQILRAFLKETPEKTKETPEKTDADVKKRWEDFKPFLTNNEPEHKDNKLGRRLILPLHHDQHRKLAQSFIDSSGKLRKENWGLAEMKISAGYLAQRATSEIGGLDASGNDILVPVAMPGVCRNADNPHNCLMCSPSNHLKCYDTDDECPLKNRRFHLGHRFRIGKPKDILVIVRVFGPNDDVDDQHNADYLAKVGERFDLPKFANEGIHFAYAVRKDKSGTNGMDVAAAADDEEFECYSIQKEGEKKEDRIGRFNYRYVIVPDELDPSDKIGLDSLWQFGFRRVFSKEVQIPKNEDVADGNGKTNETLTSMSDLLTTNTPSGSKADKGKESRITIPTLRKAVQSAWVQKLAKKCQNLQNSSVKLVVNVDGNETGSERGLVTREDLLRTMFLECYHTALVSFIKSPPEALSLSDTTKHLVTLLSLIKVMPESEYMVKPQQDYGHGDDRGAKEYIREQLARYCDLLKSHLRLSVEFNEALESIETYVKDEGGRGRAVVARKIEDIGNDFEKAIARRIFRGKQDDDETVRRECAALIPFLQTVDKDVLDRMLDAFHGAGDEFAGRSQGSDERSRKDPYGPGRHSFDENIRAIIRACSVPEEDEFDALVESLNSMFLASDVYLRKYEERIATLPEAYRHDGSQEAVGKPGADDQTESLQDIADRLLTGHGTDKDGGKALSRDKIVKYSRHDRARPDKAIYAEALSGSQSYLNALARLTAASGKDDRHAERYAAVARLLENAFLRILIIDERVMNFVNDRRSDRMIETFINMGIWIADVNNEGVPEPSSMVRDRLYQFHHPDIVGTSKEHANYVDIEPDRFDVLVIHQGIIDKWWERHDKDKVSTILNDLRLSIPRVVVTTGRGRPDNIPDHEKVLPFSVIESSLFRRYPEKLILVNTIMNLLPYGKEGEKV